MELDVALRSEAANDAVPYSHEPVREQRSSVARLYYRAPKIAGRPLGGAIKRVFDIVAACGAAIVLFPVLLAIAIVVKIQDGGPVLYGQRRVGFNGKPFYCLKFRSMCVDAEVRLEEYLAANPQAAIEWRASRKLKNDPRVTFFGAILRKTSMDELPQLVNILRGEMSMVGPRPIVSDEIGNYGRTLRHYYACRPGLTGLWQVSGRNDTTYGQRVALDRAYVARWSLGVDCLILARTIPAIFRRRGAY